MTSRASKEASKKSAQLLPNRMILPEGLVCPGPEYLGEDMLQAEPVPESDQILRAK